MNYQKNDTRLKLYANVRITEGKTRSLIMDLQRNKHFLIPNSMVQIIKTEEGKKISDIYLKYPDSTDFLDSYFDLLFNEEMILQVPEDIYENFPPIDFTYISESKIANSIIECDHLEISQIKNVFQQLDVLNCKYIQLKFYNTILLSKLYEILNLSLELNIKSIDILLPFSNEFEKNNLESLLLDHLRLRLVVFSSSIQDKIENLGLENMQKVIHMEEKVDDSFHCGQINPSLFHVDLNFYAEGQKNNTCLNQKVSIDKNGDIKNCPSMLESYGNIRDTSLSEVLEIPGFKKYWNIGKDKVHVCKDCEFRYICTDCRAFVEDPDDIYSKPLKCGYNPYSGEWSEWSSNPLKQKAIDVYEMRDLVMAE